MIADDDSSLRFGNVCPAVESFTLSQYVLPSLESSGYKVESKFKQPEARPEARQEDQSTCPPCFPSLLIEICSWYQDRFLFEICTYH